jgi:hypothetical protein
MNEEQLTQVVNGDVAVLAGLNGSGVPSSVDTSRFTVTADTVKRLLTALASNPKDWQDIGRWGHFIRFGGFEYEQGHEEAIETVVCRMEELGDAVDGEITPEEAAELIQALGGNSEVEE